MFPAASSFQRGIISRVTGIDLPYNRQARPPEIRSSRSAVPLSPIVHPKRGKLVTRGWTVSINVDARVSKPSDPLRVSRYFRDRFADRRAARQIAADFPYMLQDEQDEQEEHRTGRNAYTLHEITRGCRQVVLRANISKPSVNRGGCAAHLRAPTARIHYKTDAIGTLGGGEGEGEGGEGRRRRGLVAAMKNSATGHD